ncbi:MAG: orotate phosphoribosyltransferase-like protein, partial [Methanomicrobiales archaeon]|nr:orotate phosphoribosyltransferase-like protein [Methanomicrobiales archaeon]
MSTLEELISRAKLLLSDGHSPSQIADELSLSMETVTWLLTQQKGAEVPKDVHIDWTIVSQNPALLEDAALMLTEHFQSSMSHKDLEACPDSGYADVVVGIALSGIPLATIIALHENLKIGVYFPAKHSTGQTPVGSISGNFAPVAGERCVIVDDVITSGKTLREVVGYIRRHGGNPIAIWTLFDKRGISDMEGVPVFSLFRISRL